jgi:hypothetical protein
VKHGSIFLRLHCVACHALVDRYKLQCIELQVFIVYANFLKVDTNGAGVDVVLESSLPVTTVSVYVLSTQLHSIGR